MLFAIRLSKSDWTELLIAIAVGAALSFLAQIARNTAKRANIDPKSNAKPKSQMPVHKLSPNQVGQWTPEQVRKHDKARDNVS